MNYYERHLGDYARDTAHLTMVEHGAYCLLLDRCYATEQGIPEGQEHRLARARTPAEKAAVDAVLKEFFNLVGGFWINNRAASEIVKAQGKIKTAKENGRLGGRPKKGASTPDLKTHGKPTGLFIGSENETQAKPKQKLTRHQTPDTRHQTPDDTHTLPVQAASQAAAIESVCLDSENSIFFGSNGNNAQIQDQQPQINDDKTSVQPPHALDCTSPMPEQGSQEASQKKALSESSDYGFEESVLPSKKTAICTVMRSLGIQGINQSNQKLIALIASDATTAGEFETASRIAAENQKPTMAYVLGIVGGMRKDAQAEIAKPRPTPQHRRIGRDDFDGIDYGEVRSI